MSDFYITLPSNVVGEGNKTSDFRTRLPEPLLFKNKWNVALHEILISGEILTVPKNSPFVITLNNGQRVYCYLPKGTYKTPQALAAALNNAIPKTRKRRSNPVVTVEEEEEEDDDDEILSVTEEELEGIKIEGRADWTDEQWAEHWRAKAATEEVQNNAAPLPKPNDSSTEESAKPSTTNDHGNKEEDEKRDQAAADAQALKEEQQKEELRLAMNREKERKKTEEAEEHRKKVEAKRLKIEEEERRLEEERRVAERERYLREQKEREDLLRQAEEEEMDDLAIMSVSEEEVPVGALPGEPLPTHVVFTYEEGVGKIVVNFNYNVSRLDLSSDIAYMCGFANETLDDSVVGVHAPDCTNGKSLLYVYSDVCDWSVCGSQKTNLLRVIPCMNARNDTVSQSFQQIRYVGVRSEYVDSIRIQILDSFGKDVTIQGYICVILHLRKE